MIAQRRFPAQNDPTWRQSPTSAKKVGYWRMLYAIRIFLRITQPPNLQRQTSLALCVPSSSTIHPLLFINRLGRLGRLGKFIERGSLHHTQPYPTYPTSGGPQEVG